MNIRTVEFQTPKGRRVIINPSSVTHIQQTDNYTKDENAELVFICMFGYTATIVGNIENVRKLIWGVPS